MTQRSATPTFVGRRAELDAYESAIDDARHGLPSLLLVSGDAGMGKTTLIAEGARRWQVPLYLGRGVHVGGDVIPLMPVADLLRQVRRAVPHTRVDLELSTDLFATILDLVGRLAGDDVVALGIEDLHWADEATWDLFEFLARNLIDERVLLIGTHRANEADSASSHERRLAELGRIPGALRIHLTGLDREDVTSQAAELLGVPAPAGLVDSVLTRGQGNPFFIGELVAAHLSGDEIPIVLSDLISADIAKLDDATCDVLAAIAAVGHDTDHDLLMRATGLGRAILEPAVRVAVDAHLLVVDKDAYRFRHPLIGEVVYAGLLPPERARLHGRLAQAMGAKPASTLGRADRASEHAFHLDHAGDVGAAFVALLAAADLTASTLPGATFGHLARALELWDLAGVSAGDERRLDRMWQVAELADATIGSEEAVELAQAASAVGPHPQGQAWGHERLGRYLWTAGRLAESHIEFERAAASLASNEGPEAARVFAGLSQAELMAGRFEAADGLSRRAIELTATFDADPLAWVVARHVQGTVRNHLGDPDAGVDLCRDAFEAAPTAHSRGMCAFLYGVVLLSAGRTQEAINVALDAVAEGTRAGLDRSLGAVTDVVAAEGLMRLGRWDEAEGVLERRVDDAVPLGAMRVARAGAMLAARRGDADRARTLLARATAYPSDGMHQSFLDVGAADVHLILGEWAEAATLAERGWNANPTAALLWTARFAMLTVEATVEQTLDALAARRPTDLDAIVTRLRERIATVRIEVAKQTSSRPGRDTSAHLAQASASLTRLTAPDPDAWVEAVEGWRQLGDQWWTAVALLHHAEAAASAGAAGPAARALREAHSMADELGAGTLLEQVNATARRTRISVGVATRIDLDERSITQLGLTPREAEVLALVSGGQTNRQIADDLFVSAKTASVHVSNIMRKLGVSSRVEAAAVAQRLGAA